MLYDFGSHSLPWLVECLWCGNWISPYVVCPCIVGAVATGDTLPPGVCKNDPPPPPGTPVKTDDPQKIPGSSPPRHSNPSPINPDATPKTGDKDVDDTTPEPKTKTKTTTSTTAAEDFDVDALLGLLRECRTTLLAPLDEDYGPRLDAVVTAIDATIGPEPQP